MQLRDETEYNAWKANQTDDDGYGRAIFVFAEKWADLMEERIAAGHEVKDIAEETEEIAIKDSGLTGFMYSAAAGILAHSWLHGEPFRRWFNTHHQLGNEGDRANEKGTILNTAVLYIGT